MNPCPICGSKDQFRKVCEIGEGRQIVACECGLQALFPLPSKEEIQQIYGDEYYTFSGIETHFEEVFNLKLKTSKWLIHLANKFVHKSDNLRHLDIGCAFGYMIEAAQSSGYHSQGLEISMAADIAIRLGYNVKKAELEDAAFPDGYFDLITAVDVLEHMLEPDRWLQECSRILKKGGILLLVTPDCSSLPARIRKSKWPHFKTEHIYYYSSQTLEKLLSNTGFKKVVKKTGIRFLTLRYILNHYKKFQPNSIETTILRMLQFFCPRKIFGYPFAFLSEMVFFARKI